MVSWLVLKLLNSQPQARQTAHLASVMYLKPQWVILTEVCSSPPTSRFMKLAVAASSRLVAPLTIQGVRRKIPRVATSWLRLRSSCVSMQGSSRNNRFAGGSVVRHHFFGARTCVE